jgi:hypothetical protein
MNTDFIYKIDCQGTLAALLARDAKAALNGAMVG